MTVRAFSPAHCTIFFQPVISQGKFIGSRGVGICLNKGAVARAEEREGLHVACNSCHPTTTISALRSIDAKNVEIQIENHLPLSQGFGMSAAGTLSALLSYFHITGKGDIYDAAKIAHSAEVAERTGLGDVSAQITGGVCVREDGGVPPDAKVYRIPMPIRTVAACVFGEGMSTKRVLSDELKVKKIIECGKRCMSEFLYDKSVEKLFNLGYKFGKETGITSPEIIAIIDEISRRGLGIATPVMIGNTILCLEPKDELIKFLKEMGNVYVCGVDMCGCRIL